MKALRIRLKYLYDGSILHWTIRRVPRTWGVHPDGPLSHSRYMTGWEYEDHDGVVRFQEGNWRDLLPRVRLTAENYGCEILTELS